MSTNGDPGVVGRAAYTKMRALLDGSTEDCILRLAQLRDKLHQHGKHVGDDFQHFVLMVVDTICTSNSERSITEVKKIHRSVVELYKCMFDKLQVVDEAIFIFTYSFLIKELTANKKILKAPNDDENYRLAVVHCLSSLIKSIDDHVCQTLYKKSNTLFLSEALFTLREVAKNEKFVPLKLASIECLMLLCGVDTKLSNSSESVLRHQIAQVLMTVSPGIISGLANIALASEIQNHKISALALKALGKIVVLQMQRYNLPDDDVDPFARVDPSKITSLPPERWKNLKEVHEYVTKSNMNLAWYRRSDGELRKIVAEFFRLTCHRHPKVKMELLEATLHILETCTETLPRTIAKLFETTIILADDENENVQNLAKNVLSCYHKNENVFEKLIDSFEDNFYDSLTALPRVFNGFDDKEQLTGLGLVIGYLKLFGDEHLVRVLRSVNHLNRLVETLLSVAELERKHVGLLSEYMIQDFELVADRRMPWKEFRYFSSEEVRNKLEYAWACLAIDGVKTTVCNVLLELFALNDEKRKEIVFALNSIVDGFSDGTVGENDKSLLESIFNTYLDPENWKLSMEVSHSCMLSQVQNNVIQICLQVEGISKIALVFKENFKRYLFKSMFPILECTGSGHPIIKTAGTAALVSISASCGYENVAEMINSNADYFSYHIITKIRRSEHNENILNVLAVVIKYSKIENLATLSNILSGVLMQSCDKFFQEQNASAYLRLFRMFIKHVIECYDVAMCIEPIESKFEKEAKYQEFQVHHEDAELEKPQVPFIIRMVAEILERCVHFVPSKNRETKLLALQILNEGSEILREWEDILLPLVYRIWSPLTDRFNERDDLIVINYSFQLLVTLARLSKDFIRSRCASSVLPKLCALIEECSKTSNLQDRGSAYRYTQAYKLQTTVLTNWARVLIDTDSSDEIIRKVMDAVLPYLSKTQPLPLQAAARDFFGSMAKYDQDTVKSYLDDSKKETNTITNIEIIQKAW